MNVLRMIRVLLLLTLALNAASKISAQETCDQEGCADAQQVGKDVQEALVSANATALNGLSLKKVVLTLETAANDSVGVDINFFIFTLKHKTKKTDTVQQQFDWEDIRKQSGAAAKGQNLKQTLAKAIYSASVTASQVQVLPLKESTITIKFVVDKDNGGSLSYKILGISLGPNVDFDKVSTNSLVVTFGK